MKSPIAASFRLLLRDWRGGELGVLFSALLLAVTVVVAISGFVNRLQFNLERESASFLAADLVVSSAKPVPLEWRAKVDTAGLQQGETITFSSMVISDNDEMFLASVKAVGGDYPLRGSLSVDVGSAQPSSRIPASGSVFLAPRLVQQLRVAVGDPVYVWVMPR